MAPNNALGKPTAAKLRASYEGTPAKSPSRRASRSPAARRRKAETSVDSVRVSSADGFGATSSEQLASPNVLDRSEVTGRGTGTAVRTPLEEFEARPRDELRCFWTAVMFLTRLPCPGWCDHHPGYLMRAMAYFPLLGAMIGVWAAAIYDAAACMWPPLVAAALSAGGTLWLTGCFHEDGLCDTLDGFGGGWTKVSQDLHSRTARLIARHRPPPHLVRRAHVRAEPNPTHHARLAQRLLRHDGRLPVGGRQGGRHRANRCGRRHLGLGARRLLGRGSGDSGCTGRRAGLRGAADLRVHVRDACPCMHGAVRASRLTVALPAHTSAPSPGRYVVDDEDAKGEYYNWFGESRRLLGLPRVLLSCCLATAIACGVYGADSGGAAPRVLATTALGTLIAGEYGRSVLGGVMGDFLGATICMLELAIYLAISANVQTFGAEDARALGWLGIVLSAPQIYGAYRRWYERRNGLTTVPPQEC